MEVIHLWNSDDNSSSEASLPFYDVVPGEYSAASRHSWKSNATDAKFGGDTDWTSEDSGPLDVLSHASKPPILIPWNSSVSSTHLLGESSTVDDFLDRRPQRDYFGLASHESPPSYDGEKTFAISSHASLPNTEPQGELELSRELFGGDPRNDALREPSYESDYVSFEGQYEPSLLNQMRRGKVPPDVLSHGYRSLTTSSDVQSLADAPTTEDKDTSAENEEDEGTTDDSSWPHVSQSTQEGADGTDGTSSVKRVVLEDAEVYSIPPSPKDEPRKTWCCW